MKISNPTAILGENAACEFVKKKGYKILERNFRKSYGEIDIIALDRDVLVFIEVKTRSTDCYGTPFDAISISKLEQIVKGAQYYKYILHPEFPDAMRIDAIGVFVEKEKVRSIEHLIGVSGF